MSYTYHRLSHLETDSVTTPQLSTEDIDVEKSPEKKPTPRMSISVSGSRYKCHPGITAVASCWVVLQYMIMQVLYDSAMHYLYQHLPVGASAKGTQPVIYQCSSREQGAAAATSCSM